jgi:hypothetical protein
MSERDRPLMQVPRPSHALTCQSYSTISHHLVSQLLALLFLAFWAVTQMQVLKFTFLQHDALPRSDFRSRSHFQAHATPATRSPPPSLNLIYYFFFQSKLIPPKTDQC